MTRGLTGQKCTIVQTLKRRSISSENLVKMIDNLGETPKERGHLMAFTIDECRESDQTMLRDDLIIYRDCIPEHYAYKPKKSTCTIL